LLVNTSFPAYQILQWMQFRRGVVFAGRNAGYMHTVDAGKFKISGGTVNNRIQLRCGNSLQRGDTVGGLAVVGCA